MLWIKTLNRKNHPYTNKIKVYGISLEAILIVSFIVIVLFVMLSYLKQDHHGKKEKNSHGIIIG